MNQEIDDESSSKIEIKKYLEGFITFNKESKHAVIFGCNYFIEN